MSHLTIKVGPVEVKLDDNDRICGHIKQGKTFEPDTLAFFAEHAVPGGLLLDIGCYSGLFSIAAEKLGMTAIGFEPYPPNQTQITKNMALNAIDFDLRLAAVSDHVGTARLGFNSKVKLTAGASLERKSGEGLVVPVMTVDSLELDKPVSMIKIDVERHEAAVLRGARRVIEEHQPILIVEALDEQLTKAATDLLPGYRLHAVLDVRNLIMVPDR